jgi:hypothetical protein
VSLAALRSLLKPGWGRLTPKKAAAMGAHLGSVGYIGVGPVVLVFNLPRRFEVHDPEVFLSLDDLNRIARGARESTEFHLPH